MKVLFIILIFFSLFPLSDQVVLEDLVDGLKEIAQSIQNVFDVVKVPFQNLAKTIEDNICTRLTEHLVIPPDIKTDAISASLLVAVIRVREVLADLLCSEWCKPNI
ncbi:unnamed protein product [Caenorhabditis brenneri]